MTTRYLLRVFASMLMLMSLLVGSVALFAQTRDTAETASPAQAQTPPPRVGLVTMSPGIEYWSRFGHNAILVDDGTDRTLYNYGFFDFARQDFLLRFLRGRMLYQLVALPMERDLRGYAADGRGVRLQWLALDPSQARGLANTLAWNALPENAEYRYDYFTENCSTKVRDALDRALGGALKRDLSGRSHGYTFRDEARRLAAPLPWLYLGIHLGLGPFVDKPTSLWEEAYVPERLHDAVAQVRKPDGSALVSAEIELVPQVLPLPSTTPPEWRWYFLLTGIVVAGVLSYASRPQAAHSMRRTAAVSLAALWLASGLVGMGLIALWSLTDHVAAWGNENALLFNPLCLLLLPAATALWRGSPVPVAARRIAVAIACCAAFAFFLKFLPFRIQSNGDWIALMLPIHLALAWRLRA